MGDESEVIGNLAMFLIFLSFLFRYILNKLRKRNLIIEELTDEVVERDNFYSCLLYIIAGASVLVLVFLVIKLLST